MRHPGWTLGMLLWAFLTAFLLRHSWQAHQRERQLIHTLNDLSHGYQAFMSQVRQELPIVCVDKHIPEFKQVHPTPIPEFKRGKPKWAK